VYPRLVQVLVSLEVLHRDACPADHHDPVVGIAAAVKVLTRAVHRELGRVEREQPEDQGAETHQYRGAAHCAIRGGRRRLIRGRRLVGQLGR
jgi:hypothetical protein